MYTEGVLKNSEDKVINVGDEVIDFRGEKAIVKGWIAPYKVNSTGRVIVKTKEFNEMEYFPSVYGLHIEI